MYEKTDFMQGMSDIRKLIPLMAVASLRECWRRCVESVVKEEKQPKDNNLAEVIIIENGSSDHTKQIGTALAEKYENVFLICSEKGVSNARNAGVKAAHGEWIFFLDADDYLPAGTLQKLLDTVNSGKAADLYIFSYEKGNAIVDFQN